MAGDSISRMFAAVLWLVLLAVCPLITGDRLKCPTVMPYTGCTCYEDNFQVRCNSSANFTEFPDKLPDSTIMKIQGVKMEVLDKVPFPNLLTLFLTNNSLRVIHPYAFEELVNLKTLVLSNNSIGEISMETFIGLDAVDFIDMEFSRLYVIQGYTFIGKHLAKLNMLKLAHANIYDIKPHAFHMLLQLALLNISHNYLRMIPEFASADQLPNLTHLDMRNNQIEVISDLQNLKNLQWLFLNNNRIKQIGSHDFHGLDKTLVMVDLSFNGLNYTDPTAFIRLTRLQSLYVNNNRLKSMMWEELPWDNLIKTVLHDNPWNCQCENSWMVESELIAVHNNHSNFRCATPESVARKRVLEVPLHTFECPHRVHSIKTTLVLSLGFTISAMVAGVGAFLMCRCIRKKKRAESIRNTPTSAYKRMHEDQGELILRT